MLAGVVVAQQGPVAVMFSDDQKRDATLGRVFCRAAAGDENGSFSGARVFDAGDLERAFDTPAFRPDAAIVPTNTDL